MLEHEAKDELQQLHRLQQRWMAGSGDVIDLSVVPGSWQSVLADVPEEERALAALALASQHSLFLEGAEMAEALTTRAPIPAPTLPVVPESVRPRFRRVSEWLEKHSEPHVHLLHLLSVRGSMAHPADWLPSRSDEDLPEVYWPWMRWSVTENSQQGSTPDVLTEDNWDDFYPAERLAILRQMREADPAAARELIKACALREPAEKRLRIIEALAAGLSSADADYLAELQGDRSGKVADAAARLLSRLGLSDNASKPGENGNNEDARELAEGFELKKAILIRKRRLTPRTLKSAKQRAVRSELLAKVSPVALAKALEITLEELVTAWRFDDHRDIDNHHFVASAASSLPDSLIDALVGRLLLEGERSDSSAALLHMLLPRIGADRRLSVIAGLLGNGRIHVRLSSILNITETPLSQLGFDEIRRSWGWKTLESDVRKCLKEERYLNHYPSTADLFMLGLKAPRSVVERILETVGSWGVLLADPALDCLHLNQQLSQSQGSTHE